MRAFVLRKKIKNKKKIKKTEENRVKGKIRTGVMEII